MTWFKENKFLAALLVILVLGVGALGYLIMSASGKLTEATAEYERQVQKRTDLHNAKPYPSAENLKALIAQKDDATTRITALQKALTSNELPVEPMTPVQFQDKLRAAVTEVTTAAGATTKLPDKFFLGFERYETTTPDTVAAPLLGRELKAIQWVVMRAIEHKVTELKSLNRDPLPEEGGKEAAPAPVPSGRDRGAKAAKEEKPAAPLVQPHGIDLDLLGDQAALRALLNDLVGSKEQFFIPRLLSFKNEKDRPPQRAEAAAPAAAAADPNAPAPDPNAPAAPATPAAATGGQATEYIVGLEKVAMTLRLEMVDFTEPAAPPAAK